MDIKTVIEIQQWCDSIKTTVCIMVSSDKLNTNDITQNYCTLRGLPSINNLPDNILRDVTSDFITYLKDIGFSELKTNKIYFSD